MSSKLKLITQLCLSVYILFLGITTFNQTKTWNNSLTLWNNVMDIHGEFFFPLQQRGIAHRLVKNYEAAIDDFETAISYKPDYYRTYEQRGYVYSLTSDFQKAEKDFQKAVELHPESYTAWSNLGFIYRQTENYEKSMDCLNNAINYNSTYVDAYINRAETLKSIGKHNEACNDLTIAKSKIPTKLQIKKITKLINEIGCNQ